MSNHFRPDPRGFSSEAGMRLLSLEALKGMTRGRAGEGESVVALARKEIKRRAQVQQFTERTPLWALSPFEQELHRAKGTALKQEGGFCALA